jgi:hydrogenase maturation protease
MMLRTLVVGYGNTLCGDDALGPLVIERLRPLLPATELVACHQLAPELAATLSEVDAVIFVDAAVEEGEPGTVRVVRLSPAAEQTASLTHHISPAALLAMSAELYGRAPKAMLITGVGADFSLYGEASAPLSPAARRALDEICRLVPLLIEADPQSW